MAGELAAFAGKGLALADSGVQGQAGEPTLAVGGRDGSLEAGMASTRTSERSMRSWMVGAFWVVGIGLLVVEMSAGMDYVQASLKQQMVDFLDWIPAMGVMALNFAQKAFWSFGRVESALGVMPMVTLPFVLLGVGLALGKCTVR